MPEKLIPIELRQFSQWICWRYEYRNGSKPTKVPYDAKTGSRADVTNPACWSDFDTATSVAANNEYAGIGFCLSRSDPFVFIDLDNPDNDTEIIRSHNLILKQFAHTYAELSPSGAGIHIIGKGTIPAARKQHKVEIYDHDRYMTMTGEIYTNAPIADVQPLVSQLYQDMGGSSTPEPPNIADSPETYTDEQILAMAMSASNGDLFARLWTGQWESCNRYPSQSEADQALANMLQFYSGNFEQVERMFRNSALGQRPKADRSDYVRRTVEKSFDNVRRGTAFPPGSAEGLSAGGKTWQQSHSQETPALRVIRASDLAGKPVPKHDWLVPRWIPSSTITLIYGDGGVGKSTVALQLLFAAATGTPWLGEPTTAGPAVYFCAEDTLDEVHITLEKVARQCELTLSDADQLHIIPVADDEPNGILATFDRNNHLMQPTSLWPKLVDIVSALSPTLLLIDNIADVFAGNENDRIHVIQFMKRLRDLARQHKCAVVALAHPSVAGIQAGSGTSGSTHWNNTARSRLYMTFNYEVDGKKIVLENSRTLTRLKSNWAPTGEEMTLHWNEGVFTRVGGSGILAAVNHLNNAKAVFLELLELLTAQGRPPSPSPSSKYAPKVFADHPGNGGVTKHQFKRVMEHLFNDEVITIKTVGPPSRQTKIIVRTNTNGSDLHCEL